MLGFLRLEEKGEAPNIRRILLFIKSDGASIFGYAFKSGMQKAIKTLSELENKLHHGKIRDGVYSSISVYKNRNQLIKLE